MRPRKKDPFKLINRGLAEVPPRFFCTLFLKVFNYPVLDLAGNIKRGFYQLAFICDQAFLLSDCSLFLSRHYADAFT